MRKVILGIGSNLGHRIHNFKQAITRLNSIGNVSATSFLYETAPMYELNQPAFLNAALQLETKLSPEEVMLYCQDIELSLGRTSELKKVWKGPRPIDIDILFYEDQVLRTKPLNIPHSSLQERDFVLKPLADLIPNFKHPILNKTIKEIDEENDKSNKDLSYPKRVWSIYNSLAEQEKVLDFDKETFGMGVINCTPDSFSSQSSGSKINYDHLLEKCEEFYSNGFQILDIGGKYFRESTRPGADDINPEIEYERIAPLLEKIKNNERLKHLLISLDTRKSFVARKGSEIGGSIINDVSGGQYDKRLVEVVAEKQLPYVVMHTRGTPQTMRNLNNYTNIVDEVVTELKERIDYAISKGVHKWNIFVDPGIGFAKRRDQNIEIIRNLDVIRERLPYPLVVGYSNKKFIEEIAGKENLSYGNSVLAGACVEKGSAVLRLHDPKVYKSILLADSIYKKRKIFL